jgi:hypothetical protein
MNLQTTSEAEGVFKTYGRKRTRKRDWINKARAIKQLMCGPKLLKNTMPRVMPKSTTIAKQSLADRSDRLPFVGPVLRPNRRWHERRKSVTPVCSERRTRDRRTRIVQGKRMPDKYYLNKVGKLKVLPQPRNEGLVYVSHHQGPLTTGPVLETEQQGRKR